MSILNKTINYILNTDVTANNKIKQKNTKVDYITYNPDHFIQNGKYKTILVLTAFEDSINSNFFNDCLKQNIKVDIKVKYNIFNKRKAKFTIQNTEKKLNNANSSHNDDDVFNDLSTSRLDDIAVDLEQMKGLIGSNKMIEFIYLVTVESFSLDNLLINSKEVINIASDNGFTLTKCLYNQEKAHEETINNLISMKQYCKKLIDFDFIKLLPVREKKQSINKLNIFIGRTKESKQFLTLPFLETSNDNYHSLILGSTGFGKSLLAKTILLQARLKNYNVIVIDPQGEYAKLSKKLNGEVKKVGFNQSFKLLNSNMTDSEKESYVSILSDYLVNLNKSEDLRNKINACLYELLNNNNPNLDLFFKIVSDKDKKDKLNNNLVDSIAPLFKGNLGKMLNGSQELKVDNKFTVFDFSELQTDDTDDKFKSMFLSLFTLVISRSLHERSNKTIFFIDEAYTLLDDISSRTFLIKMMKKIRKMNTAVILSLQDLNSSSDDFGKTLFNLCNNKFIFRQPDTSFLLPYLDREMLLAINQFNQGDYLLINQDTKTLCQTIDPDLMPNIKNLITY